MAWFDGENGENFMTALGFPQYGNNKGTSQIWETNRE